MHRASCHGVLCGASNTAGASGLSNEGERDSHKILTPEPDPEEKDNAEELGMALGSGCAGNRRASLAAGV